jgi:extracellular elastinolytic metalloproteinase
VSNELTLLFFIHSGNNVVAYKGTQANVTSQSADDLVFDYTYDTAVAPGVAPNVDAARTNAFYVINTVHDIAYRYGFTEAAFNFQSDNFEKGGSANDRVLMSVQDSSGTNNANFATPPE